MYDSLDLWKPQHMFLWHLRNFLLYGSCLLVLLGHSWNVVKLWFYVLLYLLGYLSLFSFPFLRWKRPAWAVELDTTWWLSLPQGCILSLELGHWRYLNSIPVFYIILLRTPYYNRSFILKLVTIYLARNSMCLNSVLFWWFVLILSDYPSECTSKICSSNYHLHY